MAEHLPGVAVWDPDTDGALPVLQRPECRPGPPRKPPEVSTHHTVGCGQSLTNIPLFVCCCWSKTETLVEIPDPFCSCQSDLSLSFLISLKCKMCRVGHSKTLHNIMRAIMGYNLNPLICMIVFKIFSAVFSTAAPAITVRYIQVRCQTNLFFHLDEPVKCMKFSRAYYASRLNQA